jgi:hypothetical protein
MVVKWLRAATLDAHRRHGEEFLYKGVRNGPEQSPRESQELQIRCGCPDPSQPLKVPDQPTDIQLVVQKGGDPRVRYLVDMMKRLVSSVTW